MPEKANIERIKKILVAIDKIFKNCKDGVEIALKDEVTKQPAIIMQFINIHTMLKGILESGDIDCIGLFEKNDIKAINTTRNIAAHEYEELNYGLIQKAISERLPQIQKKLSEFVKSQK